MARKKKSFDLGKEVKAIARERVGRIPAEKTIQPKSRRKKPKHKVSPESEAGLSRDLPLKMSGNSRVGIASKRVTRERRSS